MTMTLNQAISCEVRRYVIACERHDLRQAHLRFLALQRLRHHVYTSKELYRVA